MATKHTVRRSTVNAIAQQVNPDFPVEFINEAGEREEYKLFIETDGDFAHVRFAARGACPECVAFDEKAQAEIARKIAEHREDEI